jgi:hypothetical protein
MDNPKLTDKQLKDPQYRKIKNSYLQRKRLRHREGCRAGRAVTVLEDNGLLGNTVRATSLEPAPRRLLSGFYDRAGFSDLSISSAT